MPSDESDIANGRNGEDGPGDVPSSKCMTNGGISESGTVVVITKCATASDPIINSIADNICRSIQVSTYLLL